MGSPHPTHCVIHPGRAALRHLPFVVVLAALLSPCSGADSEANQASAPSPSAARKFDLAERRRAHWAWQTVGKPKPPKVQNRRWPAQPTDRFILAKLEESGLHPAPEADRRTLARRLSCLLTGLPPTPDAVRSFVNERSGRAYENLVDRLLNSPRFGERWARHWLDVVRYSETLGHEFDYPIPNAWRYRDYVIRAFNQDLPYDRLVREHIAGDLMDPPRRDFESGVNESTTATAFYWFGQQVHSPVDIQAHALDVVDNQIDTLMRGFQALTVSCARCHDHKFDAISTRDFYALYGVLGSSRYQQAEISDISTATRQLDHLARLRSALSGALPVSPVSSPPLPALEGWYRHGPAMAQADVRPGDLLYTGPDDPVVRATASFVSSRKLSTRLRGGIQSPSLVLSNRFLHLRLAGHGSRAKIIIENFQAIRAPIYGDIKKSITNQDFAWLTFDLEMWRGRRAYVEILDQTTPDLADAIAPDGYPADAWFDFAEVVASDDLRPPERPPLVETVTLNDQARAILAETEKTLAGEPQTALVPAMSDGDGFDACVFIRGAPHQPGEPVQRRYLEALNGLDHPIRHGSGRAVLADLIASTDNPLTARVWVNRVWHHLFGRGIVPTVDDFGVLGEPPSHPELLDWLADWFVTEGKWSTRELIRLLVTSSAFKQAALAAQDEFDAADPDNVLLHKWSVRRLEAEVIRDSMLAVSGRLDLTPFGPPVPVHLTDFMTGRGRPGRSGPLDGEGRRSIYLEMRRNFMPPMLLAFDTPQTAQTFGCRTRSNVPAQALILMNDPFVRQQAGLWADRMLRDSGQDFDARLTWLYQQAFQRHPSGAEQTAARSFLNDYSKEAPDDGDPWADLGHVLLNTKEFVFLN